MTTARSETSRATRNRVALHRDCSAHGGISPALKEKYEALSKSEQEKLTGHSLVKNIPQLTDPALVEALEEISAPNEKVQARRD
jgi:hypothetical protein